MQKTFEKILDQVEKMTPGLLFLLVGVVRKPIQLGLAFGSSDSGTRATRAQPES